MSKKLYHLDFVSHERKCSDVFQVVMLTLQNVYGLSVEQALQFYNFGKLTNDRNKEWTIFFRSH